MSTNKPPGGYKIPRKQKKELRKLLLEKLCHRWPREFRSRVAIRLSPFDGWMVEFHPSPYVLRKIKTT